MPTDRTSDGRKGRDRFEEAERDRADEDPDRRSGRRARTHPPTAEAEGERRPSESDRRRRDAPKEPNRSRRRTRRNGGSSEHAARSGPGRRRERRKRVRSNESGNASDDWSRELDGRSPRRTRPSGSNGGNDDRKRVRSHRERADDSGSGESTDRQLYRPVGGESPARHRRSGRGGRRRGVDRDEWDPGSRSSPSARPSGTRSRYAERSRTAPVPGDERSVEPGDERYGGRTERGDAANERRTSGKGRYDRRRVPRAMRDEREPPTERDRERSHQSPY